MSLLRLTAPLVYCRGAQCAPFFVRIISQQEPRPSVSFADISLYYRESPPIQIGSINIFSWAVGDASPYNRRSRFLTANGCRLLAYSFKLCT